MSMKPQERVVRSSRGKPTYPDLDFTKPIDTTEARFMTEDCFGKHWDVTTTECGRCADCEMCGILYQKHVDKMANLIELQGNRKFLDTADFAGIRVGKLKMWLSMEERTTQELVDLVMAEANSDDVDAVVEWIKRFIKEDARIYTKGGVVKLRQE